MTATTSSGPSSADDLGPVVDTGATQHGIARFLFVGAVVLLGLGGRMLIQNEETRPHWIVPTLLFASGVACVAVAGTSIYLRRGVLTLHEKGLRRQVGGQALTMRFDEADQVAYFTIRLFVNHVYTATDEKLALKTEGPNGRVLSFHRRYKDPNNTQGPSPASILVRPVIERIAARNADRVARGEPVAWFPGATIHDWGVELPNGWGGKVPVRWNELEEPQIVNGVCKLKKLGKATPVYTVHSFAMNFFPGLEIVRRYVARSR
jgi:hypothetical protein